MAASDKDATETGVDVIPEDAQWETTEQESGQKLGFDNVGEQFVGTFVETALIEPENGEAFTQQRFRTPEGELYSFNGGFKVNRGLESATPGDLVRLTYMGDIDTGQPSPMKDFKVEISRKKSAT
jgi:hypothetical protein